MATVLFPYYYKTSQCNIDVGCVVIVKAEDYTKSEWEDDYIKSECVEDYIKSEWVED